MYIIYLHDNMAMNLGLWHWLCWFNCISVKCNTANRSFGSLGVWV